MNFTNIILILAVLGLIISLLMKFSKTANKMLRLDDPAVNKKYVNYKINFFMAISIVLIIFELLGIANPEIASKFDVYMSAFLLLAIAVDFIIKQRMRKSVKK